MNIKKLFALMLCAIAMCFTLASCEEAIGDYQYDWKPEPEVKLEFDLYIITDSNNDEEAVKAMTTVNSRINQYLDTAYDTILDIHYIQETDYAATVEALANGTLKDDKVSAGRKCGGTIVLVVGEDMYNSLAEKNVLVNLKPFLDTNAFGKLNTQLSSALLDVATVNNNGVESLYVIPNDHVIGEYEYTIVKRDIAEGVLNFSAQSEILEMNIVDGVANEIAAELIAAVEANISELGVSSVADVIRVEKGSYEDKAYFESLGYICNVAKYPEVDSSVAFAAGFGIFKTADVYSEVDGENVVYASAALCEERAMQVIYAINSNEDVRNLLQYGVENTHYKVEYVEVETEDGKKVVEYVVPYEDNAYKMNLLYTGDAFMAYYCDEVVFRNGEKSSTWSYDVVINGEAQNKQAVIGK